jgi:mannose/fructose/N-acetylgalactosamine-specific phosphotransferase system component IID
MCRTEGAARWVSEFAVCVLRIALSLIAGWLIGSWLSQPGDVKEAFSGRERWDEALLYRRRLAVLIPCAVGAVYAMICMVLHFRRRVAVWQLVIEVMILGVLLAVLGKLAS